MLRQLGIEGEEVNDLKDRLDQLETGNGRELGPQQKWEIMRHIQCL